MSGAGARIPDDIDLVVIGAGQAGLAAAGELVHCGMRPGVDFLVLDAEEGPGGAWRHRWDSLTVGKAHRISDLPHLKAGPMDEDRPSSQVVCEYYGRYEEAFDLAVVRPVHVRSVRSSAVLATPLVLGSSSIDEAGAVRPPEGIRRDTLLEIEWERADTGETGLLRARMIVNATGTWTRPYRPSVPRRRRVPGPRPRYDAVREGAGFRGRAGPRRRRRSVRRPVPPRARARRGVDRMGDAQAAELHGTRLRLRVERRGREGGRREDGDRGSARLGRADDRNPETPRLPRGDSVRRARQPRDVRPRRGVRRALLPARDPVGPLGARAERARSSLRRARRTGLVEALSVGHVGRGRHDLLEYRVPRVLLVGYGSGASTFGATRAGREAGRIAMVRLTGAAKRAL